MKEAEPIRKLDLSLEPEKLMADFRRNTDKMKQQLENAKLETFISTETEGSPVFLKAVSMLKKAAKRRKFTLKPLIAEFNSNSDQAHHLRRLLLNNEEIKIAFVQPTYECENYLYEYILYIPIPNNMLDNEPYDQLKEHWNMVMETIPPKMRRDLVKKFVPIFTIERVYGWDAAYIAYRVVVCDDGSFWSVPLVRSPFNGVQPFIALKDGEFVIIERDQTDLEKSNLNKVESDIYRRVASNPYVSIKQGKSIEIPPEVVASSIDFSNAHVDINVESKKSGRGLASLSIDKCLPDSTRDLLKSMHTEVFGAPQYIFSEEETTKCRIVNV